MEETTAKAPEVVRPASNLPAAPARPATHAAPVMDVHRPATPQPAGQVHATEASRLVHEAPKEDDDKQLHENDSDQQAVVQAKKAAKPAKPHQPGVAGAIVATVIIVLGLAGLAVYAYLKSQ